MRKRGQAARNAAELHLGESGVVDSVGGAGALHRRLIDLGFTPNVRVTLRRVAPLGDPVELRLRGYSLTLRRADAATIRLKEARGA